MEIVKGCSCKNKQKKCTTCNCKKIDLRDKKCTAVTCRSCGCFDRNREQSDDDTLSLSSSTEFSTDTESDGIAEPLINYRRDVISSDEDFWIVLINVVNNIMLFLFYPQTQQEWAL